MRATRNRFIVKRIAGHTLSSSLLQEDPSFAKLDRTVERCNVLQYCLAIPFTSSIHVLFDTIVLTGREHGNIGRTAHAFSTPRHFLSPASPSAGRPDSLLSYEEKEREREGLLPLATRVGPWSDDREEATVYSSSMDVSIAPWRPFEYENIPRHELK